MPNWTTLPHQKLIAYQVARQLVVCVRDAKITDSKLRDQAMRAAISVCLNIAEADGRTSNPDKARVFGIARGESCEAVAALDVASAAGYCSPESAQAATSLGLRLYALLTALSRKLLSG